MQIWVAGGPVPSLRGTAYRPFSVLGDLSIYASIVQQKGIDMQENSSCYREEYSALWNEVLHLKGCGSHSVEGGDAVTCDVLQTRV
jgi:hypothetical protein